ncbi:hypothetical protein CLAFUW4_14160 [Fulvia fulva]|uniref:Uncharacterized protein n=1 Tax=Passalora fulva TaxID=5499 RepID=A0A9Q8PKF5_PASFU|nr:uncharacterized protein CLAFUR5_13994 [Fulvia fulva]KAK4610528.1 hypothetical protein CLAFUR4_14163 [Fulvia fulva]KAK4610924.1 hypothetical protein CLAFUR0_14167 [Fulvia fulva]UJO24284.1 hypothetical protein CLAFUR5_13994 [Fulvia fulva]WPV22284.1 hypothetical protein CLAFUW4_14160 [Fulvia fulva]WPV37161.1 hypothetical protein CLAFUW7_14171 [Fulvia fulva]
MAPFLPGDYLTYSGIRVGAEVICYEIVAENVQILTPSGPTYIRIEDALIGVFDSQSQNIVEHADNRFIGCVSNPSAQVTIARIEVDPCTGETKDVNVGSATLKTGDIRNKWEWRAESTALQRYTREYRITASTGTGSTNGGQILAGQYVQPVTEGIFPEAVTPGRLSAKNDFSQFTHLRDGLGPDEDGNL